MTEIYLHFLFAHYGLYGNAPVCSRRISEHQCGVQTQVYGLLQKRGHRRKNFTLRLFVLDNVGVVSYYRLGETRVRGRFKLADVVRCHNSCMVMRAQHYVGKSQSCMVISGRFTVRAPASWQAQITRQDLSSEPNALKRYLKPVATLGRHPVPVGKRKHADRAYALLGAFEDAYSVTRAHKNCR